MKSMLWRMCRKDYLLETAPWILAELQFGLSNKKRYEIHDNLMTIIKGGGGGGGWGMVLKCEVIGWHDFAVYDLWHIRFPKLRFLTTLQSGEGAVMCMRPKTEVL